MLKVLRKYRQWVLAIGGTLLMVSFLAPQAVTQMRGDPAKQVIASLGTEKVRAGELQQAAMEYKALEDFDDTLIRRGLGVENGDHWFLLTKEAERAGLVGEHGDGESFLPVLAQELAPKLAAQMQLMELQRQSPDLLRQIDPQIAMSFAQQMAANDMRDPEKHKKLVEEATGILVSRMHRGAGETRMTETQFYQALAKARGVMRLVNTYAGAARVSDRLAISEAALRADAVYTDLVVIPADRALSGIAEPTAEEIQANYEKYRDTAPGEGEFAIGYRQPNRVKVEWLRLDKAAFDAAVTVDPVEVRKKQTIDRAKDPQGFAAERARIEAELKEAQVSQLMSEAAQIVVAQVKTQTRKLETDGDFKKLPTDWAANRPNWESIAQKVVEGLKTTRGVTVALPTVVSKSGSWLTQNEVMTLDGLGQASLHLGPRTAPVAQAIMDVKELDGKGAGVGLQALVPQIEPPATDMAGNRYYFTVLEARKTSAPDSIDEVRDEVVKNTKLLKGYEALKSGAEEYKRLAGEQGLETVSKLFPGEMPAAVPGQEPVAPPPLIVRKGVGVMRDQVNPQDAALDVAAFRDTAREVGLKLDPVADPATVPAEQRVYTAALPKDRSLVVGMVIGRKPITNESFRRIASRQIEGLGFEELRTAAGAEGPLAPLSFKSLSERMQFKYKGREDGGK